MRIIAATNRNLEALSSDGTFRQDLLYRLKVMLLELPPLRQRGDVRLLAEHFLRVFPANMRRRGTACPLRPPRRSAAITGRAR